jgi:hypothetical protein
VRAGRGVLKEVEREVVRPRRAGGGFAQEPRVDEVVASQLGEARQAAATGLAASRCGATASGAPPLGRDQPLARRDRCLDAERHAGVGVDDSGHEGAEIGGRAAARAARGSTAPYAVEDRELRAGCHEDHPIAAREPCRM